MNKNVIIIGAGGHGKVIADIVEKSEDNLLGFFDDNLKKGTKIIKDYCILGQTKDYVKFEKANNLYYIIAVGDNYTRKKIFEEYKLNYYTAIHPSAIIGMNVEIGIGTVIMANTCINPNTKIGKNSIINTGAIVEHDNIIGDYVHISPNATLCGTVQIGDFTHIGASSIVKNNISICNNCKIGAGAVVIKNIEESGTYIGVPAKIMKG